LHPAPIAVAVERMAGKDAASKPGAKRSKSVTGSIVELVVIVVVAVGLALGIQAFVVKPYKIPSASMEPTLVEGQRVMVNRIAMDFSSPHVGEIAVFHPPKDAEREECRAVHVPTAACDSPEPEDKSQNFIKRIVAGPGDEIYVTNGHVSRKAAGKSRFVVDSDSFIKACGRSPECNFRTPITIPAGHWFMMGDNRGDSDDSRYWGPVPTSWIIGQAIATYWPPDRVGIF
jgi:signal peptidase I